MSKSRVAIIVVLVVAIIIVLASQGFAYTMQAEVCGVCRLGDSGYVITYADTRGEEWQTKETAPRSIGDRVVLHFSMHGTTDYIYDDVITRVSE